MWQSAGYVPSLKLTAAGTAPDFHRIPFSGAARRTTCVTGKDTSDLCDGCSFVSGFFSTVIFQKYFGSQAGIFAHVHIEKVEIARMVIFSSIKNAAREVGALCPENRLMDLCVGNLWSDFGKGRDDAAQVEGRISIGRLGSPQQRIGNEYARCTIRAVVALPGTPRHQATNVLW